MHCNGESVKRSPILCNIKLFRISNQNNNEMYICRICRRTFSGTKRRESLRHHIKKHFVRNIKTSRYKTVAPTNHDRNNDALFCQQTQADLETDVNTSIQLTHSTSSVTTSGDSLSYASYDEREKRLFVESKPNPNVVCQCVQVEEVQSQHELLNLEVVESD